ncbi:MAG TPA: asparagine synthase (glutamine-hydrolyzing) [Gemmatimonadaceae bacterium]|nr:asparagine synthase (glutamine-hydrolyzing) [Gemmatimonadaceae bacterium]
MCGIAGVVIHGIAGCDALHTARRMTDAVRHRGPDDGDVVALSSVAPIVAFGHRRLSIIDLSARGHQPMTDRVTGVTITYNGEIYNFRELRRELEQAGHVFTSGTDTEVILRGYEEWGRDVVSRLRGIFAFALWDPKPRTVLLARDQLGVKPLYVYERDGVVLFASEVRAILASGIVPRALDLDGMRSYLAYGSVQEPLTLVRGVRSLPPGATAVIGEHGVTAHRYYELPAPLPQQNGRTTEDVRERLVQAVGSQLVADVPLGAFLSGGIDSSAIALLMRRGGTSDVRTFNVCFRDDVALDERRYARLAADAAGATHTDIELGEQDFLDNVEAALAAYDQPSVDGINTWFVSRAVRGAGMTVALAGVGGDELFVGYDRFAKARRAERFGRLRHAVPPALRCPLGRALETRGRTEAIRKGGMLLESSLPPYFSTRRVFGPATVDGLLDPGLRDGGREAWAGVSLATMDHVDDRDTINRISRFELQSYLVSTLLRDTDQMAMAHALEVRVPLIDTSIVDAVLPLPGASKISADTPKSLLVRSLDGAIPHDCVYRPKRGFTLPFDRWLRGSGGTHAAEELLAAPPPPLNAGAVRQVHTAFRAGRTSWSRLWSVFVLSDWIQRHGLSV